MPEILTANPEHINRCVDRIRAGELIGLPTETVYGLAANANSEQAVKKVFQAKGRPENHPLIVHIASPLHPSEAKMEDWLDVLTPWAREVPPPAIKLAMTFWPGPLTIILPKAKGVLDLVTGGQDTVGLRCPNHPVAQQVLQQFKGGLAIPSANRFGRISPTTAQHVLSEFKDVGLNLLILDGGPCQVGIESTIVDLTHWDTIGPVILRPGVITADQIAQCTQMKLGEKPGANIRFSGGLSAHYAPRTSLILVSADTKEIPKLSGKIAWAAWVSPQDLGVDTSNLVISPQKFPKEAQEAAKVLYQLLRELDTRQFDCLVFPVLPNTHEWAGVRDRLSRASIGSGSGTA